MSFKNLVCYHGQTVEFKLELANGRARPTEYNQTDRVQSGLTLRAG